MRLECGGSTPLWSAAARRRFRALEPPDANNRRQAAGYQSGVKPPHSKEVLFLEVRPVVYYQTQLNSTSWQVEEWDELDGSQ